MTIATGKLTDLGVERLRVKLAGMNKRAVRLGLDKLVLTLGERTAVKTKGPTGLDYTVFVNEVEVAGCLPCIEGWSCVARIEFTELGNLVHCAPGVDDLDSSYRTVKNKCDHCNTNRIRNDILVLRGSEGQEICVGRNCVADFVRSGGAEGLIWYASWLGSDICGERDEDWEMGGKRGKPTEGVLTIV